MSCLEECVLSRDDTLGYGVRQILGANPRTSLVTAGRYMKLIKHAVGGMVTIENFPIVLNAMASGDLSVGANPARVEQSCIALYEYCLGRSGDINMAELKKAKVYGVGQWCIMYMARVRCGGKCWVPGDSSVRKKMVEAGLIDEDDKKHDDWAVEEWGDPSLAKSNLNRYFSPDLDANFSRLNSAS